MNSNLPFPYKMGIWSVAKRVFVLMPTRRGEPRRVATHSPGKWIDLKHKANAPSWIQINIKITQNSNQSLSLSLFVSSFQGYLRNFTSLTGIYSRKSFIKYFSKNIIRNFCLHFLFKMSFIWSSIINYSKVVLCINICIKICYYTYTRYIKKKNKVVFSCFV